MPAAAKVIDQQPDAEQTNVELFRQIEQEIAAAGDDREDTWLDGENDSGDADDDPTPAAKKGKTSAKRKQVPGSQGDEDAQTETDDASEAEGSEGGEDSGEVEDETEDDDGESDGEEDEELAQATEFAKKRGLKLVDPKDHERRFQIDLRRAKREQRAKLEQDYYQARAELEKRGRVFAGFEDAVKLREEGDIDGAVQAAFGVTLQDLNKLGVQQLQGMTPRQRRELEQVRKEREQLNAERKQREEREQHEQRARNRQVYVQNVAGQLSASKNPKHKALAQEFASMVVAEQERHLFPGATQDDVVPLDEAADAVLEQLSQHHARLSKLFGSREPAGKAAKPESGTPETPPEGSDSARPARSKKRARSIRQSDAAAVSGTRKHYTDEQLKRMALEEWDPDS